MAHIIDPANPQITDGALIRMVTSLPGQPKGSTVMYQFDTREEAEEYDRATASNSHVEFFQKRVGGLMGVPQEAAAQHLNEIDEQEAKQSMRRMEAIKELVQHTFVRVDPGSMAAEYITFEQFRQMSLDYQNALDAGESHASAHRRTGFQPCSVYVNKLYFTKDKDGNEVKRARPIRPLFQHEVGVRPNGTIIMLRDHFPDDVGTVVVGAHSKFQGGAKPSILVDEHGAPMESAAPAVDSAEETGEA